LPTSECIKGILIQAQEALDQIQSLDQDEENDPELAQKIEDRLDQIHRLKKKYGSDLEKINNHLKEAKAKLYQIRHLEEREETLLKEKESIEKKLLDICQKLSQRREDVKSKLEFQIESVLKDLNMPHASFSIEKKDRSIGASGSETIEFFLCPNPGEPRRSVRKFASGGEMARLFMALKTLKAHKRIPPTLIFDEIDSNIGGESAVKLAHKFKEMSLSRQVICITHFAQVAKEADYHLMTEKRVEKIL
jgi:DNA repair protein RecN (Recombination protein N)